jgi:hypothetical protein
MKKIMKTVYILSSIIFIVYLLIPNQDFPKPLPDSIRSFEPADAESTLRRAYYTNLTREEVMSYYVNQINKSPVFSIYLPTYRLNYPPEEAQSLIRDQTRSTFLEEIVHPFRDSLYVNGFEPKLQKDRINVAGKSWRQKVIVRYVPSNILTRLLVGFLTISIIPILYHQWNLALNKLKDIFKK